MAEIKLNKEIISVLQNCKDAKEIMAFAKCKGVELSEEQAGKLFAALKNDKLNDEELEKVVGGFSVAALDVLATAAFSALSDGKQEKDCIIKPSNS